MCKKISSFLKLFSKKEGVLDLKYEILLYFKLSFGLSINAFLLPLLI